MKNDHDRKKSRAVMALPLCISAGMLAGVVIGTVMKNIPIGIAFGMSTGAAVGMMVFGVLYCKARDAEIKEYEEKFIKGDHNIDDVI